MMRANQFVQFQVQRFSVAILGVLDEKNHQESDDRGPGIDDELPCIREMEVRSAKSPEGNHEYSRQKHVRMAHHLGRLAGKRLNQRLIPWVFLTCSLASI